MAQCKQISVKENLTTYLFLFVTLDSFNVLYLQCITSGVNLISKLLLYIFFYPPILRIKAYFRYLKERSKYYKFLPQLLVCNSKWNKNLTFENTVNTNKMWSCLLIITYKLSQYSTFHLSDSTNIIYFLILNSTQ